MLRYLTHQLGHDEAAIATWYNHWIAAGFEAIEPLLAQMRAPALSATAIHPALPTSPSFRRSSMPSATSSISRPYPTLVRIYENCMRLEPFIAAQPRNQPDYEG